MDQEFLMIISFVFCSSTENQIFIFFYLYFYNGLIFFYI